MSLEHGSTLTKLAAVRDAELSDLSHPVIRHAVSAILALLERPGNPGQLITFPRLREPDTITPTNAALWGVCSGLGVGLLAGVREGVLCGLGTMVLVAHNNANQSRKQASALKVYSRMASNVKAAARRWAALRDARSQHLGPTDCPLFWAQDLYPQEVIQSMVCPVPGLIEPTVLATYLRVASLETVGLTDDAARIRQCFFLDEDGSYFECLMEEVDSLQHEDAFGFEPSFKVNSPWGTYFFGSFTRDDDSSTIRTSSSGSRSVTVKEAPMLRSCSGLLGAKKLDLEHRLSYVVLVRHDHLNERFAPFNADLSTYNDRVFAPPGLGVHVESIQGGAT